MTPYLLRDGTLLDIRPIRADDGERLRESHARLSPESRYRRFLGTKPQLTAADARYLVEIDGSDHLALVATLDEDPETIVAVARYIRLLEDPQVAEFAIVVGDAFQQQGLATELLERLARAARMHGVLRFRATMFTDNVAVHRLLERYNGAPLRIHRAGTISEVELELRAPQASNGSLAPAMIAGCVGS